MCVLTTISRRGRCMIDTAPLLFAVCFLLDFFLYYEHQTAMLSFLLCMDDELKNNVTKITRITPVIKHRARRMWLHDFCRRHRRQKYSEYHHHVQELPETAENDKRIALTGNIKCPPNLLFPVSLVITSCPTYTAPHRQRWPKPASWFARWGVPTNQLLYVIGRLKRVSVMLTVAVLKNDFQQEALGVQYLHKVDAGCYASSLDGSLLLQMLSPHCEQLKKKKKHLT